MWPSADTKNKHALTSYAKLFPPMVAAIDRRRILEARRPSDGIHNMTLGFGEHGDRTFRSLYGARDVRTRHYVQYVRKLKIPEGSQIYRLQQYILARDKEPSVHASVDPKTESDEEPMDVAAEVDSQDSTIRDDLLAPVQSTSSLVGPQAARAPAVTVSAQTGSGAQLLPRGWRATLPEEQQDWVGRALFCRTDSGQSVLKTDLQMWWYPPGPRPIYSQPPTTSHPFFQQPFFLWMPYKMWAYPLKCPTCKASLRAAGLYKTVRRVLDRHSWYFMGTEYLECYTCRKKVAGWSQAILEQLDLSLRMDFPAVLTYRLACDKTLISALKECTLGNSATRLHSTLVEEHTTAWIHRTKKKYLGVLRKLEVRQSQPFPEMHPVPGVSWLIGVYIREAISRLPETKARITSVFGTILKMVSTKKVNKKLAGAAAGSAAWSTNVGNEHGQVLMSVLTAAEGDGLADMASGLVRRYHDAGQAPPKVLYVNRDCCTSVGQSRVGQLFHEWPELVVRLDEGFEQEGEEGLDDYDEEEQLEEIHLLKYHHALLLQEREKANTEIVVGPDGHPGYQHVVALALALAELRHRPFVSQRQANDIIALWQRLPDRDKQPVSFPPRHQDRFVRGHLRTSHRRADSAPSMESMKRTVLGQGARAAHSPKVSRLMEALMLELCRDQEDKSTMTARVRTHRWHTVVKNYKLIRDNVVSCHTLMANTRIALYEVNQRTVSSW
ncbi:uncharacterized protein ACB058_005817 [Synchiropus picturatus]